jgi:glycosyltransferase involved in cell wall biosynthesis
MTQESIFDQIDRRIQAVQELDAQINLDPIEKKIDNILIKEEKKQETKTLVAIPCYNEEKTIGSVILKAKKYADEVVIIDDGSIDKTTTIAELAGAKIVRHKKNKGYGAAIQSCFNYARENNFDVMTILDGDGQHDPDQIYTVMRPVSEGKADISIGSRFMDSHGNMVPMYRRFGIAVLTKITNGFSDDEEKVGDGQSGFRTYSRKAIENIDPKDPNMGVSAEILMQGKKKKLSFSEVPITCSYEGDTSTQGPIGHGISVIISILQYLEVEHSLLVFGLTGFLMFVSGLILGMISYLSYKDLGYFPFAQTSLAGLLFITGMLMGMTGLILHAVINESRRR